jgi:hypothetical protein
MLELKCQNCGGQLEVDEDDVKVGDGWVYYRSRETLTCKYCGTQFVSGDDLMCDKGSLGDVTIVGDGNIVVGNISNSSGVVIGGGNVVIGGDVVGGNLIVTGSGNRIRRSW